jgi:hypothetical protein
MQAYEFYATPENGTIKIPEQYRDIITSGVKVILLEQKPFRRGGDMTKGQNKSDLLLSPTLSTKGWKFNREEANER